MKALVLESNGKLSYRDVPDPEVENNECLIKVKCAGVCTSDLLRIYEHGAYLYPLIMGHEFAGEIVEVGQDVKNFSVGQKVSAFPLLPCKKCSACRERKWVFCDSYDYFGSRRDGAFAEYVAVPEWNLLSIPEGVSMELACLCEPLAVALHAFKAIPRKKFARLAVLGAGFIGISLAQIAKKSDCFKEIWLLDRNDFKLKIGQELGLHTKLIKVGKDNKPDLNNLFKSFPVVVEACGATSTYRDSLKLASTGGTVIWMGNIQGDLLISKKEVSSILRKELNIKGIWNSDYQFKESSDWTDAMEIIKRGEDWLSKLITHRVGLREGISVFKRLYKLKKEHKPHSFLKVIFVFH